jgi:hypothetical protein
MPIGPGKYDELATMVRKHAGMSKEDGGGVIVIVLGGDKGNGFSVQADLMTTLTLPDILESIARQMRKDGAQL